MSDCTAYMHPSRLSPQVIHNYEAYAVYTNEIINETVRVGYACVLYQI